MNLNNFLPKNIWLTNYLILSLYQEIKINIMKTFIYEGKEYTCTEQDILYKCGSSALELHRCKKGRYGFEIIYKMKPGHYDNRDSALVSTFIYYFSLIKK